MKADDFFSDELKTMVRESFGTTPLGLCDMIASNRLDDYITVAMQTVERITEEKESFIFETLRPFCEEVVQHEITKRDLEQALLKYYGKSGWIPCSERLPYLDNPKTIKEAHKGYDFLTTLSTGSVVITKRKFYVSGQHGEHFFGTWGWSRRGKTKVVAWQPLPAPYKGEEE